eukprot:gene16643-22746_t
MDSTSVVANPIEESVKPKRLAYFYEIFFLGPVIITTGHQSVWNLMLVAGFWNTFFYCGFMGSGFLALVSCLGEMSSLFPFSGGGYAFARLTLGPFVGFLVGCCEAVEYIIFVAAGFLFAGQLITSATGLPHNYELIYWAVFFIITIGIQIQGGKYFWPSVAFLGICLILLELLFFASVYQLDFHKYVIAADPSASGQQSLSFQATQFMTQFPTAAWMYGGLESVALACNETSEARINIPRAMVWSMFTIIILCLLNVIIASSQYPGVGDLSGALSTTAFAFNSVYGVSLKYADLFALPASFLSGFGLIYSYSKQLASMAQSHLFHPSLGIVTNETRVPYVAMLFLSSVTYILLVLIHFDIIDIIDFLNLCFMCSFVVYLCLLVTYLFFKFKYSSLERQYINPAGIYGACYGIFVFSLGLIGALFFQETTTALINFAVFIGVMSIYYYFYARNRQFFSEDEQKILLIAYVIKANNARRHLVIRSTGAKKNSGVKNSSGYLSTIKKNAVAPSNGKYSNRDNSVSVSSTTMKTRSKHHEYDTIDKGSNSTTVGPQNAFSSYENTSSKTIMQWPATIIELYDVDNNDQLNKQVEKSDRKVYDFTTHSSHTDNKFFDSDLVVEDV